MATWAQRRAALLSLIETISGLQTVWADSEQPYYDPVEQAVVKLRILDSRIQGHAERRLTDLGVAAPAPNLEESIDALRALLFEVRVESWIQDDDRFAFNAALDIRNSLDFTSSLAALRAVELSLARINETIDLPQVSEEDRAISTAILNVQLNMAVTQADTDNPLHSIETVAVEYAP